MKTSDMIRVSRLRPLAACLAVAFGLGEPLSVMAATLYVTNCLDDNSAGSLRQVIAGAADTDIVDLHTHLSCSSITLSKGEISIGVNNLSLIGPGPDKLKIAVGAKYNNRVLHDTGTGILDIRDVTISGGTVTATNASAIGGCIYSPSGTVSLYRTTISGCTVEATRSSGSTQIAAGGAIDASSVSLDRSRVTGNLALASGAGCYATGGGVSASNVDLVGYDVLSGNSAQGVNSATGSGGAITAPVASVYNSTIASNQASNTGGGIAVFDGPVSTGQLTIANSTISGNTAPQGSAIFASFATEHFYNDTLAFNSSDSEAAVYLTQSNATIVSSIIAKNASNSLFKDLGIASSASVSGNHNLIMSTNVATMPDTISAEPWLTNLAYHGINAPTPTIALNPMSPAIGKGSDPKSWAWDQRGGFFNREVPTGTTDIGAYERQNPDDEIFYGGFE